MGVSEKCRPSAGISLASQAGVLDAPSHSSSEQPIVLWRMRRPNGLQSHAVIGPRSDGAIVIWFVNGRVMGYRDFGDWTSALGWSDRLQAQNWAAGWRVATEQE